jgi:hypothetical protein
MTEEERLLEDVEDTNAFEERATDPVLDFEDFVKDLRRRDKM